MPREDAIMRGIAATEPQGGEIWECGVFRGDLIEWMLLPPWSDSPLKLDVSHRQLRLFDTFTGQPFSGPHDVHLVGSMNETDQATVIARFAPFPNVTIHPGIMPATFAGLEDRLISVVNIDVDNHDSVRDCLTFLYPRVHAGGYIILDDYGCPNCPGAKVATDAFMADKPEHLVVGPGPQAHFIKL